jgi:DNA-binding XRE family transcriptional regulator
VSVMQEENNLFVSFRLKEERERLGFGQAVLAGAAEVTVKTVGRWEKEIPIPSDKLSRLGTLGFDILYIVTGTRSQSALAADELLLLNEFRAMDEKTRKRMLAFALGGESTQITRYEGSHMDFKQAPTGAVLGGDLVIGKKRK